MEDRLVFDPIDHYWGLGKQQANSGDPISALKAYRKALRLAGDDPATARRIRMAMGDAYFDARQYAKAEALWQAQLPDLAGGEKAWLLWRLARLQLRRRSFAMAERLLKQAGALAPEDEPMLNAQLALQDAELARLRKAYPIAKQALRRALRDAARLDGPIGLNLQLAAYEALFKIHKAAKDMAGGLRLLLEIHPRLMEAGMAEDLIDPLTDVGIALIRQNQAKLAEKAFATALSCCPDPTAEVYLLSNYASVLCEVGKYADAYLHIQKAIAYADIDDPQSPEFLATLYDTAAYICTQRHQLDQARMWIGKALDRLAKMPSSPFPVASIYLNLALVEEKAGQYDAALAALHQARAQSPDSRLIQREILRLDKHLQREKARQKGHRPSSPPPDS